MFFINIKYRLRLNKETAMNTEIFLQWTPIWCLPTTKTAYILQQFFVHELKKEL